ncbi:hypothetical protein ACRAWF_19790 [Streptomyces sp. L7]
MHRAEIDLLRRFRRHPRRRATGLEPLRRTRPATPGGPRRLVHHEWWNPGHGRSVERRKTDDDRVSPGGPTAGAGAERRVRTGGRERNMYKHTMVGLCHGQCRRHARLPAVGTLVRRPRRR